MEMKPNNPVLFAVAVAIITIAILFVLSMKTQMASEFKDGNNTDAMLKKTALFPKAPELRGIAGYINAPDGFKLSDVKGKVVLVDIWTYTCINCIRTLPYLTAWDEKYRDKGLVIVGVHSPEFEFEKEYANVKKAVEKYGIKYPVVLDNDHATWNAYNNRFWPHKYLIDADGFIRYDHIGEGGYEETEELIQKLLAERDEKIQMGTLVSANVSAPSVDYTQIGTPEIYLGYDFARASLGNPEGFKPDQTVDYTLPVGFRPNVVYLEGSWKNNPDNMELVSDSGKVVLQFQAKNANIVSGGNSSLTIKLDGAAPTASQLGSDAKLTANGTAMVAVGEQRLYSIIDKPDYTQQTVTIEIKGKGFRIYTFTFG
jgi:thiol-disulfide isomerase/thioredoxin